MAELVMGGHCQNAKKTIYLKNLLGTYFVQELILYKPVGISIYNGIYQGFSYDNEPRN